MKRSFAVLLALVLTVCCPMLALADLEIVQELYVPLEEFEGAYAGYIFAEIANTGDEAVGFEMAVFDVKDAQGNVVSSYDGYLCYPSTIGPGETAFFADYQFVEGVSSVGEIPGYSLQIVSGDPFYDVPAELSVISAECVDMIDSWGDQVYKVMVQVKNETDEQIMDPTLTFGVYDEAGTLIYAGATTVYSSVVPVGTEATYCLDIDYAFDQMWRMTGTIPAKVKLRAIVE